MIVPGYLFMAPIRRSRRRAGTTAEPNGDLATSRPSRPGNNCREPRDVDHELDDSPIASNSQDNRFWTPEPEPYDEEAYTAWGRKHYGEDWYEQRELMFQERNLVKLDVKDDHIYLERQKALRQMEREREEGKLLLDRAKTWQELMAWARMHYGDVWFAQRQALEQDKQREKEAEGRSDEYKKSKKARRRRELVRNLQWDKDEEMLAQGKTWQEIMAWPPQPSSIIPPTEMAMSEATGADPVRSPSVSSDDSMISTYPPTPSDCRREAKHGPQPIYPQKGYDSDVAWKEAMGSANWEGFEWRAIAWRWSEAEYEEGKKGKVEVLRHKRSLREYVESKRRDLDERADIGHANRFLRGADKEIQRERRIRDIDLRQRGWTQEDIDALDREIDARRKEFRERKQKDMDTPWIPDKPKNQAQMNARFRAWDAAGLRREMQNEMARSYGFQERPPSVDGHDETGHMWVSQWKDWDEQPKQPVVPIPPPNPPRDHKEMNKRFLIWDERGVGRERQIELARLYGFNARPTSPDGHLESMVASPSQSSPRSKKDDPLRKSRGGRIVKTAPKRQPSGPGGQSRHSASTHVDAGQRRDPSKSAELVELDTTALEWRKRPRNTRGEEGSSKNEAAPSPPPVNPGRGRKVKSTVMNTAEQPGSLKLRRSARIAHQLEQAKRAKQSEVPVEQLYSTKPTPSRNAARDKRKKARGTVSSERGARSPKISSSKPQDIVKKKKARRRKT
ncbi:hypothetical protein NKR23_g8951 [Pleurostoma richardsiae]|uniref:Uncharacterized protein n=1 Tax=Pleurostoma richardsiae TaxID=41990 RepID=A0AA38RRL4_9PEZI|nr:hypothetical protein NKR23_g8951 [Pleurostoma richardsiae]